MHLLGVAARILASLTAFLMTLCPLSLDAYAHLQQAIFQFSQASSQLSFAAKKTLSLVNRSSLNPGHILHGQLTEPQAVSKERLKSRHPFFPVAWKLLHNLSELRIHAAKWANLSWDTEYFKNTSALCVYILKVTTRPIGMSLTRTAWVKLNRLDWAFRFVHAQIGSRFFSKMRVWR